MQRPHSSSVPGLLATTPSPAASSKRPLSSSGSRSPPPSSRGLYDGLEHSGGLASTSLFSPSSKLGMMSLPNPAPEIDLAPPAAPVAAAMPPPPAQVQMGQDFVDPDEPKKKKYAKEAWPGKKPTPSLLV